jgi:ankyrin repeat protein
MVSLLLTHGAVTEVEDANGNTPLFRAVFDSRGRGDVIALLLRAGADRDHENKHGVTPAQLAATIGNYDVAQFFTTDGGC